MSETIDGAPAHTQTKPAGAKRRPRRRRRARGARQLPDARPVAQPDETQLAALAALRGALEDCDASDRARLGSRIDRLEQSAASAAAIERLRGAIASGAARR
ncbi:MAG: hypothetical protein ACR2RL_05705, partial [Gammaproteobacteria bacterium]